MNGSKRKLENGDSKLDLLSPSATWLLMMSHLTKTFPDPSGRRVFFTDNFYTRHSLADKLKSMTDGEACIIGTVKFTNVDGTNRMFHVTLSRHCDGILCQQSDVMT